MNYQFDVNAIIGIRIVDRRPGGYEWLPSKESRRFFGILRPTVYPEGFYQGGQYENWMSSKAYTKEELEGYDYIVDNDNSVWRRPYATVYLAHDYQVTKYFQTLNEANEWVEELKDTSGKTFEIVND